MGKIYGNILETIGHTPLVELRRFGTHYGVKARLAAKLERFNCTGSAKDRAALYILRDAEASGRLSPGGMVIEATSGNTGVGLAAAAAVLGYRAVIVMPDNMSAERKQLMSAYGAQLILTPGAEGMAGAIKRAKEIHQENPGSIIADQFGNPANVRAHYETTGPEIWADAPELSAFVACIGTGGTVSGTGKYLKEQNSNIKIIGVEPAASPVLTENRAGPHGIQGIGAGFVPEILDRDLLDEIITVTDQEAFDAARLLAASEGILSGISSGAAAVAAAKLAARPEYADKLVVVLLPDTGERYLSVF